MIIELLDRKYLLVCAVFVLLLWMTTQGTAEEKPVRVMIVTGVDYPGHPWRTQAVELRKALATEPRLDVRLVEDVEIFGTDMIFDYDVLMMNFKNYEPLKREESAKTNLLRFMAEGGGMMCFHFTGGAFQDWPDFARIVGRVWNPELRGHDPYQEFTIRVKQKEHPIMRGVSDFKITDELYTCLIGQKEIDVLADAVSSVDGETYPMVFTYTEGKGRGFYTVLGHDAKAFEAPELAVILRNAALWCAAKDAQPSAATTAAPSRVDEIKSTLGAGEKLLAYIDCGGDVKVDEGLKITALGELETYCFASVVPAGLTSQASVLFAKESVSFLIEGLDRAKKYRLNVVWWDCDANGRVQSLIVRSPDESQVRILRPGRALPDYMESKSPPQTVSVALPMTYVRDGKLRLDVKNEAGPNAVVSEIWITELP